MNTNLARNLLHLITYARRQPLWQSLNFLEQSQWWPYEKIKEYQERKLNKLLKHCSENVPFYKDWFKSNGCKPSDVKICNLHLLPVIEKSFLRDNLNQLSAQHYNEPFEHAKTSGSTGTPIHFPKSLKSSALQIAALLRGHKWHGVEPGDKEARLWGVPLNTLSRYKGNIIDFLLNRFREREYSLNDDVLKDFGSRLKRHKPVYLMGYTSMVTEFALYLRRTGQDGHVYNFKMVKCTAETIHDSDRAVVETVFGCPLVSEYGAAETGLIAFQCAEGSQHLMSDCSIVEFLAPQQNVGDLNLKEVVVTNPDNFALPFIRYKVGNLAIPSFDKCSCGRELPLITKRIGRTEDLIRMSDGRCWPSSILDFILKELAFKYASMNQYKVYQKTMDKLEFLLVPNSHFNAKSEKYIRSKCIEYFGQNMEVDINLVKTIPRELSGKLRDFVSTLKENN